MPRVDFLRIKPSKFFCKIQNKTGLTLRRMADVCKVHQRSMSDWKNAKSLMPLLVFKKLCKIGGFKSVSVRIFPEHWHIKKAARKGAFARNRIYGNPGTPEGRSRGGKATCQKLHSNPEFAKKIGFLTRKEIYYPQKSPKLAELIGILMGDGGIKNYQVVVTLNKETEKEYAFCIAKFFKDLFHLNSTIREDNDENVCEVVVSSKNLVEYLIKLGLKNGNKIKQQIDIPDWIERDEKLKRACLRGLIDTDGCFYIDTHKIKNKRYFNPGLVFTTYSLPLFLSVRRILKSLNYHPTREGRNIFLRRENEIIRYFREIGSSNSNYTLRFKNFLETYRKRNY